MGADLYIQTTTRVELQRQLMEIDARYPDNEGYSDEDIVTFQDMQHELYTTTTENGQDLYFRDSYNSNSIFHQLNLSWWSHVTPLQDEEGLLQLPAISYVIELIENHGRPTMETIRKTYAGMRAHFPDQYEEKSDRYFEESQKHFSEKYDKLLKFFKYALEHRYTISASL